ncbi:hypothetical protein ABT364_19790 [Massilia sp. SR12]
MKSILLASHSQARVEKKEMLELEPNLLDMISGGADCGCGGENHDYR